MRPADGMNVLVQHVHPEVVAGIVLVADIAHFGIVAGELHDHGDPVRLGVVLGAKGELRVGHRVCVGHLESQIVDVARPQNAERHVPEQRDGCGARLLLLDELGP